MQKFADGSSGKLQRRTGWWPGGWLLALMGLLALTGHAQTNAVPANDAFANAEVISGYAGSTNVVNTGATLEAGESAVVVTDDDTFGVPVGASVWFTWTATANGSVTFNTIAPGGTGFQTVLAVYTGNNVADLTLVGADLDQNGALTNASETSFFASAGTTYFIGVYGFNEPPVAEGTTMLNWVQVTPANSAGQFRFTSTAYTVSDFESFPLWGPNPPMSATAGARISVTRVGGAVGKVEVNYTVTNALESVTESNEVDTVSYASVTVSTNGTVTATSAILITNSYFWFPTLGNPTNYCALLAFGTNEPQSYFTYVDLETSNGVALPPLIITNLPAFFPQEIFTVYGFPTNGIGEVTNADGSVTTDTTNIMATLTGTNILAPGAIALTPQNVNAGWDYAPASGTLTFNDFEMTKDIFVTVSTNDYIASTPVQFIVTLDSATLDPNGAGNLQG